MISFFISVLSLTLILTSGAAMWFVVVRRDDPDRK